MSAALVHEMANINESICGHLHAHFVESYSGDNTNATASGRAQVEESQAVRLVPNEIVGEIVRQLPSTEDLLNFRLVCKRFALGGRHTFLAVIAATRVVFPRYDSLADFLSLIITNHVSANNVRKVVLVAETLKVHEYGYDWAWEDLVNWQGLRMTEEDKDTVNNINVNHTNAVLTNNAFINTGAYRKLLTYLLRRLPNLEVIEVRKLNTGEHVPGWNGAKLIKNLSFYHEDLHVNNIFYGDWQYDTVHQRVTVHKDEFGDTITEPNAGPQASFLDDLWSAVDATCGRRFVKFIT